MQLKKWHQLMDAGDPAVQDFSSGPSPGGAAARLGISRQAVHHAIKRGELDVLAIYDGLRLNHYTISPESLQRYQDRLRSRAKVELERLAKRL
jgi:predicted DNA-binding protein YlxM (UPF0122 family)